MMRSIAWLTALGLVVALAPLNSQQVPVSLPNGITSPVWMQAVSAIDGAGVMRTHLLFEPDTTYDIGASGATRPRNIYLGNELFLDNDDYIRANDSGGAARLLIGANTANDVLVGSASLPIVVASTGFAPGAKSVLYKATADKLTQIVDSGNVTGLELNIGTPTLGTCTGGSLTSGSHNFGGEVTGNTSGSCIITFGTPAFTNAPFCFINDESSLTAVRVSTRSVGSITVTGTPSGEDFQFFCVGRIGT